MGNQAFLVLPKDEVSAHELIALIRNYLRQIEFDKYIYIRCKGISVFFCPLKVTVYPKGETHTVANCTELILTTGDRWAQINMFKRLNLQWISWDCAPYGPVGPQGIQGDVLQHLYEKFVPISEEVSNADESEALS
jgi:hypothetical protein